MASANILADSGERDLERLISCIVGVALRLLDAKGSIGRLRVKLPSGAGEATVSRSYRLIAGRRAVVNRMKPYYRSFTDNCLTIFSIFSFSLQIPWWFRWIGSFAFQSFD
jgi:hypothetical protein